MAVNSKGKHVLSNKAAIKKMKAGKKKPTGTAKKKRASPKPHTRKLASGKTVKVNHGKGTAATVKKVVGKSVTRKPAMTMPKFNGPFGKAGSKTLAHLKKWHSKAKHLLHSTVHNAATKTFFKKNKNKHYYDSTKDPKVKKKHDSELKKLKAKHAKEIKAYKAAKATKK